MGDDKKNLRAVDAGYIQQKLDVANQERAAMTANVAELERVAHAFEAAEKAGDAEAMARLYQDSLRLAGAVLPEEDQKKLAAELNAVDDKRALALRALAQDFKKATETDAVHLYNRVVEQSLVEITVADVLVLGAELGGDPHKTHDLLEELDLHVHVDPRHPDAFLAGGDIPIEMVDAWLSADRSSRPQAREHDSKNACSVCGVVCFPLDPGEVCARCEEVSHVLEVLEPKFEAALRAQALPEIHTVGLRLFELRRQLLTWFGESIPEKLSSAVAAVEADFTKRIERQWISHEVGETASRVLRDAAGQPVTPFSSPQEQLLEGMRVLYAQPPRPHAREDFALKFHPEAATAIPMTPELRAAMTEQLGEPGPARVLDDEGNEVTQERYDAMMEAAVPGASVYIGKVDGGPLHGFPMHTIKGGGPDPWDPTRHMLALGDQRATRPDPSPAQPSIIDQNTGTGVYVEGRELSASEVAAMDARIGIVQDGGGRAPTAGPDPDEVAGQDKELLKGRDVKDFDLWKQVMEKHGFNWVEPERLDRIFGKQQHIPGRLKGTAENPLHDNIGRPIQNTSLWWYASTREGQWRSDVGTRRPHKHLLQGQEMAFTMSDLILGYVTPAAFEKFVLERIARRQLALQKEKAVAELARGRRR